MSASKMTQGQSSRRVLMGARGKTPSGVASNRHPGKRSFLQMIKRAANTVLLLIFVSRTAQCSGVGRVKELQKELQDMMGQEVQGLEYLTPGEKEDFKRQVDHYKKLCSESSNDVTLISKLSTAKSEYSKRCETLEKLVKRNKTKNKVKTVDNKAADMMLKGLRESSSKKSAAPTRQRVDPQSPAPTRRSVDTQNRFAPTSPTPTPRPSKGRPMNDAARRMRALAKQAVGTDIVQRSRQRFSRDQRKKKNKLQAEIDNLVKEIEAIAEDHEKRVDFYDSYVEQDIHWLDTWRRMSAKIMEDKILAKDEQLKSLNLRLEGLLKQMDEKYHKLQKDEIVAFTGLDNDAAN